MKENKEISSDQPKDDLDKSIGTMEFIEEDDINVGFKTLDYLDMKKIRLEKEFFKMIKLVTSFAEFKENLLYYQVKLVVEPNRIAAFNTKCKEEYTNEPYVVLDFDYISAKLLISRKKNKFRILVLGTDKEFHFKVSNKELFERVIISLNFIIENSRGAKTNLLGVSKRKDFHKVNERLI